MFPGQKTKQNKSRTGGFSSAYQVPNNHLRLNINYKMFGLLPQASFSLSLTFLLIL